MESKTIKTCIWIYTQNLGDGSVAARCFDSQEVAEDYASYDNERSNDDIDFIDLEFDLDGNLLTPNPKRRIRLTI